MRIKAILAASVVLELALLYTVEAVAGEFLTPVPYEVTVLDVRPPNFDIDEPRDRPRPDRFEYCMQRHKNGADTEPDARDQAYCSRRYLEVKAPRPFVSSWGVTETTFEEARARWAYPPLLRWTDHPAGLVERVFTDHTDGPSFPDPYSVTVTYTPPGLLETTSLGAAVERGAVVLTASFEPDSARSGYYGSAARTATARDRTVYIRRSLRELTDLDGPRWIGKSNRDLHRVWWTERHDGGLVRWEMEVDPLRYTPAAALKLFNSLVEQ